MFKVSIGIKISILILWGFVFSLLWAWFIMPLCTSTIGIAHAFGIYLVIGMFIMVNDILEIEFNNNNEYIEFALLYILVILYYFLIGFAIKHYI